MREQSKSENHQDRQGELLLDVDRPGTGEETAAMGDAAKAETASAASLRQLLAKRRASTPCPPDGFVPADCCKASLKGGAKASCKGSSD